MNVSGICKDKILDISLKKQVSVTVLTMFIIIFNKLIQNFITCLQQILIDSVLLSQQNFLIFRIVTRNENCYNCEQRTDIFFSFLHPYYFDKQGFFLRFVATSRLQVSRST